MRDEPIAVRLRSALVVLHWRNVMVSVPLCVGAVIMLLPFLWMLSASLRPEGESYRHDWTGCEVFVAGHKVGEVLRLDPTPMGYDMVVMKDLRPGRRGRRDIPYIKAWFQVDLAARRIDLDPPEGLLDLESVGE